MPLQVTGAFAGVVNGALEVAQAVRDAFATHTNGAEARRLAATAGAGSSGSTTPEGLPWNAEAVLDWYDLGANVDSRAVGFQGVVFTGRDLCFIPFGAPSSGITSDFFVSYNTTLPFTSASSYQTIALTTIPVAGMTQAQGFLGGAIDPNGFLYMVPQAGDYPNTGGVVVRFDTSKLLSDATAYSTFDVTQLSAYGSNACTGYASACCDGRWVYLSPTRFGNYPTNSFTDHGWAIRYDTTKPFASSASWDAYNLSACVNLRLLGMQTSICDGAYVYYTPFADTLLARYQVGQAFASSTSWATFDLKSIMTQASVGLTGATRVGRYIFFTPWRQVGAAYESVMVRYDTQAAGGLTSTTSWATFDLTTISSATCKAFGYQGSVADGVYLYLVPAYSGTTPLVPPFLRYDTRGDFTDPSSWLSMTGTNTPTAMNILSTGGASDGVYGYNGPYDTVPSGTLSGLTYRWRLWPGDPDTPSRVGMSRSFWLDSSGRTGFGTQAPADQVHAATTFLPGGVTAAANVRADGLLLGQMGLSGSVAPAVAAATISTASSNNLGTGPTTLASYLLPANAFNVHNKGARVTAFGTFGPTVNAKHVYLYIGGVQVAVSPAVSASGSWYVRGSVIDKGSSSQVAAGIIGTTPFSGTSVLTTGTATPASSESAAITLAVLGRGGQSNDVVLDAFLVEFVNANTP